MRRLPLFIISIMCNNLFAAAYADQKSVISVPGVPTSYKLTHPPYNPGLFSVFNTVLGALDFFDRIDTCVGLEVDFADQGHYYESANGLNWWKYYFEPIKLSKSESDIEAAEGRFRSYEKIILSVSAEFKMPPARGHELIEKYVKLRPALKSKLEDFIEANFNGFVIGVHYRGTDKKSEAPEVPYEVVSDQLAIELTSNPDAKIFVATDEEQFLSYLQEKFPGKIIFLDAIRSNNKDPVHNSSTENGYKKGEDAVLDCILLSECSKLYKMASNLSDASLRFNPSIPVTHLNRSFSEESERDDYSLAKTFNVVLSALDMCERNEIQGFIPYFGKTDGSNWWVEFFESFRIGKDPKEVELASVDANIMALRNLMTMPSSKACELIEKFIRIKPAITNPIEDYAHSNFQDCFVIGVHYIRQPQGIIAQMQPTIDSNRIIHELSALVEGASKKVKIFLVTEDCDFTQKVRTKFPNVELIVHNNDGTIEKNMFCLSTGLLLAKTNEIIGTSSEMLKLVSQFNPSIKITPLDTWWLEIV